MTKSAHKGLRLYALFLLTLVGQLLCAQDPVEVQTPAAFCFNPLIPLPISDFTVLGGEDTDLLEGIQISISGNYNPDTDELTYVNNNGIGGNFSNGILTLNGNADLATYREALNEVYFVTTATGEDAIRSITVSLSSVDFLSENGHFYQFFPQPGISWSSARDAAAASQLFGLDGYLATITTVAENTFILERVSGTAWLGGTDMGTEGDWRWVTGPEALENGGLGRRMDDGFLNWENSEPNNQGNEDFVHMMDWSTPPGKWNDLPEAGGGGEYAPTGYIVEYGGQVGDPDVLSNIIATVNLDPLREVAISGSISVCPNIMGVPYTVNFLSGYTYEWTIDGGTVASGQGSSEITVNWGDTNPTANVSVTATSPLACETTADFAVKINEQLEPPLPLGPTEVCFTDLSTAQAYMTPVTPGSDYEWKVTGGTIVSANGTNDIEVIWDGPGVGELYFTESTSTATDICDGDSPVLTVNLRQETVPEFLITPVSCYNGSDGAIALTGYTGATPYSLTWNTAGQGTSTATSTSGLSAGDYSVDIDANGCLINIPFTITEPTELTGAVDAVDALCFGEASGMATANVTGGTGTYRYEWSNGVTTMGNVIMNLPKGSYSVDVIDENDCILPLDFFIDEPDSLAIDEIAATLISCPNGSDGTLQATVSGGVSPYTYSWEGSTDETALATGFSRGTYILTVTDANGCLVTGTQSVEETTPKIFLPTAFSPNGDGENDTFGPTTACPFDFQMVVYNSWGTQVFATRSTTIRWDGSIKGEDAPLGKYTYTAFWSIEVNGQLLTEERKGVIRLLR